MNNLLTFWANGWIAIFIWLWSAKYAIAGLLLAGIIWGKYGWEVHHMLAYRPRRYGRGDAESARVPWHRSAAVPIGLWAIGALCVSTNVEGVESLVMWLALLIACALMAAERANLLSRHSWLMGIYGLLIIFFRVLVAQGLNFDDLTRALGAQGETALLMGSARASILPYAAITLWVVAPLAYLVALWQRYFIVRAARGAHGSPETIIASRLGRGEDRARPRIIQGTEDDW